MDITITEMTITTEEELLQKIKEIYKKVRFDNAFNINMGLTDIYNLKNGFEKTYHQISERTLSFYKRIYKELADSSKAELDRNKSLYLD